MLKEAAYWLCVAIVLVAMLITVQYVVISFSVTHNGPIRWDKGWEVLKETWLE